MHFVACSLDLARCEIGTAWHRCRLAVSQAPHVSRLQRRACTSQTSLLMLRDVLGVADPPTICHLAGPAGGRGQAMGFVLSAEDPSMTNLLHAMLALA